VQKVNLININKKNFYMQKSFQKTKLRLTAYTNIFIFYLFTVLSSCQILKQVTDPVTGVVRRGSCISIEIPPITLTPESTAAERQLLGENKEIEKNSWIIASSQSVSLEESRSENLSTENRKKLQHLYREKAVLDFFQEDIKNYLNNGLLGQDYSGYILLVPLQISKYGGQDRLSVLSEQKKASRVASEVNQSRKWIYEYYLELEKEKTKPNLEKILNEHLIIYWKQAPRGVWVRNENKTWIRRE